jgi:hypothetical protein
MKKKIKAGVFIPVVGGILLVLAGLVLLLNNFGIIQLNWEMLVGPLFGIGGLVFLAVYLLDRDNWWALIPGFVLIGLGIIFFMGQNLESMAEELGGAVFLGLLGLAFLLIYITHRENWWAIIPGGVLVTLAGVTLIPEDSVLMGGAFFLGLAVTFGLVYILPSPSGRMKWALYPAGILLILGILVMLGATNLLNYVWPLALLIAGAYVIYLAVRKK